MNIYYIPEFLFWFMAIVTPIILCIQWCRNKIKIAQEKYKKANQEAQEAYAKMNDMEKMIHEQQNLNKTIIICACIIGYILLQRIL